MKAPALLEGAGVFSTQVAVVSFAIGSLIFLAYTAFPDASELVVAGFFYVMLAFLVNAMVLLQLLYLFFGHPQWRRYFAFRVLIMLANVPVVVLYLFAIIS